MSHFFTDLEDIVYSVVEYIPGVGTVYSFKRAIFALEHHDSKRFWQSAANSLESLVRDVILYKGTTETATVAIIHAITESLTDKSIEIYLHEPDKPKPKVKITKNLDEQKEHVFINEPPDGNFKNQVFRGKAKGVHYFHGAVFIGKFVNPKYAPNGENIRLDVPHGFYDGARVTFAWKWTQDYYGVKNRPEVTIGHIKLVAGTPTEFQLSSRKSAGGWEAYDFWGKILSKTQIIATFRIDGSKHDIVFNRSPGT